MSRQPFPGRMGPRGEASRIVINIGRRVPRVETEWLIMNQPSSGSGPRLRQSTLSRFCCESVKTNLAWRLLRSISEDHPDIQYRKRGRAKSWLYFPARSFLSIYPQLLEKQVRYVNDKIFFCATCSFCASRYIQHPYFDLLFAN